MKLSASNIAWDASADERMYGTLARMGYAGVEIAPTRIFPESPYDRCADAAAFAARLRETYGLSVPSRQSRWYGRTENIFGAEQERAALAEYLRKAIDFAAAVHCGNLVFGCPKNRVGTNEKDWETAVAFFREAGTYAAQKGTRIGMEANPAVYGTQFVNETKYAFALARDVASEGFGVNLDVGTMLTNGESLDGIAEHLSLVTHVHVSEPGLAPVECGGLHRELAQVLRSGGYEGFVSVEMKNPGSEETLLRSLEQVREVFA